MPNTSSPELLGSGKGTKRRPNRESAPLRTTRVPEPEWLGPGRYMQPRASLGFFPGEQPRARAVWAGRLHPMEKKCKKAKWLSEEALQIAVKRREAKSKGEKERYSI